MYDAGSREGRGGKRRDTELLFSLQPCPVPSPSAEYGAELECHSRESVVQDEEE